MSKYRNFTEEKLKEKIETLEKQKLKQKDIQKKIAAETKKLKLSLNQKEIAKEKRNENKVIYMVGKMFISIAKDESIEYCISQFESEKEKQLVQTYITILRNKLKKKN